MMQFFLYTAETSLEKKIQAEFLSSMELPFQEEKTAHKPVKKPE